MISSCGLVSVSFRPIPYSDIIPLAADSGLQSIEWGGDIHVPVGALDHAKLVAAETKQAGLSVSAYGSYYIVGAYGDNYLPIFDNVLKTAVTVGAPIVRIWGGSDSHLLIQPQVREKMVSECRKLADLAKEKKITLALECHRNTLTDDWRSSKQLMQEIDRDNLRMYWQPNETRDFDYNLRALRELLPYLTNVHVFHWPKPDCREPLRNGISEWMAYLSLIAQDDAPHTCSLEFMPDNRPESLEQEAKTLFEMIHKI